MITIPAVNIKSPLSRIPSPIAEDSHFQTVIDGPLRSSAFRVHRRNFTVSGKRISKADTGFENRLLREWTQAQTLLRRHRRRRRCLSAQTRMTWRRTPPIPSTLASKVSPSPPNPQSGAGPGQPRDCSSCSDKLANSGQHGEVSSATSSSTLNNSNPSTSKNPKNTPNSPKPPKSPSKPRSSLRTASPSSGGPSATRTSSSQIIMPRRRVCSRPARLRIWPG